MSDAELVDTTTFSASFPQLPQPHIERTNLIDALTRTLTADVDLVAVEGPDGMGKTTLLALFAKAKAPNAFSIFVNDASRWTHDPALVGQDIYEQLHWYLNGERVSKTFEYSEARLRRAYLDVARRSKAERKPIFMVVDGLAEISPERMKAVVEVLPIGFPGFRYVTSGDANLFDLLAKPSRRKTIPCLPFTVPETAAYFSDLLHGDQVDELWRLTNGVPGFVASVRRSIVAGVSAETILAENPADLEEALADEWKRLAGVLEQVKVTLGVLAFDSRPHTLSSLALLTGEPITSEQAKALSPFLSLDDPAGRVRYVNEAVRRFVAHRLATTKTDVLDLVIGDLLKDPTSREAVVLLPSYLQSAQNFERLLTLLSPEHFDAVIELTRSIAALKESVAVGVQAAAHTGRASDMIRFAVHSASLRAVEGRNVPLNALRSYIALNEDSKALELAHSARILEDRLHSLSIVAAQQTKRHGAVDSTLLASIRQLYSEVTPEHIGQQALDIASDLMLVAPDLAIDLVSRSVPSDYEAGARDAAFARLSVVALGGSESDHRLRDSAQLAQSHIRDARTKQLSGALAAVVRGQDAAQVLAYVGQVDNPSDRIYLLRAWLEENSVRNDSTRVLEEALSLAIRTTDYAVSAAVLRQMAEALRSVPADDLERLLDLFETQLPTAGKLGPSEEYVRLLLLIAEAEKRLNSKRSLARFNAAVDYADGIPDIGVRCTAFAHLISPRDALDPANVIGSLRPRTLEEEFEELLSVVLRNTADHFQGTRPVLVALARRKPHMALSVAARLNTEPRRDDAYRALCEKWAQLPCEEWNPAAIARALSSVAYDFERDQAVVSLSRALGRDSQIYKQPALVGQIASAGVKVVDTTLAVLAHVGLIVAASTIKDEALTAVLTSRLDERWQGLDADWQRIDTGFRIASRLAAARPQTARLYQERAIALAATAEFWSFTSAETYARSVQLAILAYAGMVRSGISDRVRQEQLEDLIQRVPSTVERLALFGDLAVYLHFGSEAAIASELVTRRIKKELPGAEREHVMRRDAIVLTAPALYLSHKNSAVTLISELPNQEADEAYKRICLAILMRRPPTDAFDGFTGYPGGRNWDDLVDVMDVIDRMDEDGRAAAYLEIVVDQLANRKESLVSSSQRDALALRIGEIIDKKFPNPRFIAHAGYRILESATLARITQTSRAEWLALASDARALPNKPDAALVLTGIAKATKDITFKQKCFDEAFVLAQSIPLDLERARTLERLAQTARHETAFARRCLREASSMAARISGDEAFALQRRLVDLAHRIDPKLAESVVNAVDDDAVRQESRRNMRERMRMNDLQRELLDPKSTTEIPADPAQFAHAAWKCLGGLNAGSIAAVKEDALEKILGFAGRFPLEYAYPAVCVAIQDLAELAERRPQNAKSIGRAFDGALVAARVSLHLARASSGETRRVSRSTSGSTGELHHFEGADRSNFKKLLADWGQLNVGGHLWVCDQFFGPEDLEFIWIAVPESQRCHVHVLTSYAQQTELHLEHPWVEAYRAAWRRVSMQEPPWAEIIVTSVGPSRKSPSHDRVWLTESSGLEIGTSLNAIGVSQLSSARVLDAEESKAWWAKLNGFFEKTKRKTPSGEVIDYIVMLL